MDRHPERKLIREADALNNTADQMDLTHVYKIFHSSAAKYTFFSVHMEHSSVEIMLVHEQVSKSEIYHGFIH